MEKYKARTDIITKYSYSTYNGKTIFMPNDISGSQWIKEGVIVNAEKKLINNIEYILVDGTNNYYLASSFVSTPNSSAPNIKTKPEILLSVKVIIISSIVIIAGFVGIFLYAKKNRNQ